MNDEWLGRLLAAVGRTPLPASAGKLCRMCGEAKPPSEFCHDRRRPDGKYPYCRMCMSAKGKRDYVAYRKPKVQAYQQRPEVLARRRAQEKTAPYRRRQRESWAARIYCGQKYGPWHACKVCGEPVAWRPGRQRQSCGKPCWRELQRRAMLTRLRRGERPGHVASTGYVSAYPHPAVQARMS